MIEDAGEQADGAAWRVIEPYWNVIDIYSEGAEFLESLEQIPTYAQYLFAVWWADSEICNGGFHQFFSNSTGVLAPEAEKGFRKVGLLRCGEIVGVAIEKFGFEYPRDRDARQTALEGLTLPGAMRQQWDPFYTLDEDYYAAKSEFDERIDAYARKHAR